MVIGGLVIFSLIGLLSVIGNILIIVVIRKTKELRHSQYVYKSSIAVSDLIWALFLCFLVGSFIYTNFIIRKTMTCQPFESLNIAVNEKNFTAYRIQHFDCEFDSNIIPESFRFYVFLIAFFCTIFLMKITLIVSLISLVFAAGDRYFALAFPFRYRKTNTNKMAKLLSVIIWILSTIITVFMIFCMSIKGNSTTLIFLQPT